MVSGLYCIRRESLLGVKRTRWSQWQGWPRLRRRRQWQTAGGGLEKARWGPLRSAAAVWLDTPPPCFSEHSVDCSSPPTVLPPARRWRTHTHTQTRGRGKRHRTGAPAGSSASTSVSITASWPRSFCRHRQSLYSAFCRGWSSTTTCAQSVWLRWNFAPD